MTEKQPQETNNAAKSGQEDELPLPWRQIQGAIWLIGLAILFWQGWIWPGILVLVAISGVSQAMMQWYIGRQQEQRSAAQQTQAALDARRDWLPAKCPTCGGPLSVETVHWTGPSSGDCPYCSANLRPPAS